MPLAPDVGAVAQPRNSIGSKESNRFSMSIRSLESGLLGVASACINLPTTETILARMPTTSFAKSPLSGSEDFGVNFREPFRIDAHALPAHARL